MEGSEGSKGYRRQYRVGYGGNRDKSERKRARGRKRARERERERERKDDGRKEMIVRV